VFASPARELAEKNNEKEYSLELTLRPKFVNPILHCEHPGATPEPRTTRTTNGKPIAYMISSYSA
jgi:hypothetical protein